MFANNTQLSITDLNTIAGALIRNAERLEKKYDKLYKSEADANRDIAKRIWSVIDIEREHSLDKTVAMRLIALVPVDRAQVDQSTEQTHERTVTGLYVGVCDTKD